MVAPGNVSCAARRTPSRSGVSPRIPVAPTQSARVLARRVTSRFCPRSASTDRTLSPTDVPCRVTLTGLPRTSTAHGPASERHRARLPVPPMSTATIPSVTNATFLCRR